MPLQEYFPNTHNHMPIHIALTMTPHIGDHPYTEALQLTLETAADHSLDQHINEPRRPHTKIHHDPGKSHSTTHTKRNSRVTIDDSQMDFYSSDGHSSDLEEDSDHLNYLNPLSVVHPMNGEGQT